MNDPKADRPTNVLFSVLWWLLRLAGLLAAGYCFWRLRNRLVNVVNYDVVTIDAPPLPLTIVIPALVLVCLILMIASRGGVVFRSQAPAGDHARLSSAPHRTGYPLLLTIVVAAWWLAGSSPEYVGLSFAAVGIAWYIDRAGGGMAPPSSGARMERAAPVLLGAAIAISTFWHAVIQVDFWLHFLLGYADFGFFTTELEHCLPWKVVGAARFSDTRMGYHCIPMFYLLAPFYAVFRSPMFLMVVGPLLLNLAAVPFYRLAKQRSGSAIVGLAVGLAWLALPSITRLPYTNTYGFQSIFLAVPFLAWTFCLGLQGRWRASHLCLAAALLCEETVCGVALGWGIYLMLWGGRRRDGVCIAAVSVAYLVLCTTVVIPFFQGDGEYTRLMLFGNLTPGAMVDRLTRPRMAYYLIALAAPLLIGLVRSWRLLVVALPTLALVLLMHQTDYLNIKYWHQTSMLPVLFAAAVVGVTGGSLWGLKGERRGFGPPLGMLAGVMLFHFFMGSSPLAQSQRIYKANDKLRTDDPRLAVVDWVRASFSPSDTSIVATERMAAHFTDYRMVYPTPRARFSDMTNAPFVFILDRSDGWDKIIMEDTSAQTIAQAQDAGFSLVHEDGPVLVFANPAALQASRE